MKIGIFGFAGVGKTTLFQALTGVGGEPTRSGRRESLLGIARVPDPRLERLAEMFRPRKVTPATVEFVDLVGFRREDSSTAFDTEALRTADALAHVVRAFPGPMPHPEGCLDPARDAATMETELILADHTVLERRVTRLRGLVQRGAAAADRGELELLERSLAHLEKDHPLRTMELAPEERRRLRGFGLLSLRPLLLVVNLDEESIGQISSPETAFGLGSIASRPEVAVCAASARIEMEISQLTEADARGFLDHLGLGEPAAPRLLRASYALLGLRSFFTVGDDECRAWTVRAGSTARAAGGVIHSDIERGFIRAEVVSYDDLVACGSLATARDRGKLRLEGKDYPVSDGEVIHFRFAV